MAHLFEQVSFSGRKSTDRIDRTNKVIRGVKIVGLKSQNSAASTFGAEFADATGGYEYSPAAMRGAVPLVEGARVNLNHVEYSHTRGGKVQTGDHKVEDRFGRLSGVHYVDGDDETAGLYGNLEYLGKHPHADMVLEAAERMPETIALSWHAEGRPEKQPDGRVVVTKISRVRSVDLIGGRPGTNKSLFEGSPQMDPDDQVTESAATASTPVAPVKKTPQAQLHDALKEAISAVIDDQKLDVAGMVKKIKAILQAKESAVLALGGQSTGAPAPKPKPKAPAATLAESDDEDDSVQESLFEKPDKGSESLFEDCRDFSFSGVTPERYATRKPGYSGIDWDDLG